MVTFGPCTCCKLAYSRATQKSIPGIDIHLKTLARWLNKDGHLPKTSLQSFWCCTFNPTVVRPSRSLTHTPCSACNALLMVHYLLCPWINTQAGIQYYRSSLSNRWDCADVHACKTTPPYKVFHNTHGAYPALLHTALAYYGGVILFSTPATCSHSPLARPLLHVAADFQGNITLYYITLQL